MVDTIFFWLSKILWGVFSPSHFIVLLLLASFLIKPLIIRYIARGIALFILVIAFIFPVGDWALLPLEQCNENEGMPLNVDGVIALGGAVNVAVTDARGTVELNAAADRVMAFMKLLKTYQAAQFVYAGGTNSIKRPDFSEANYVKQLLETLGVNTGAIVFEGKSRSTYEDAMYTSNVHSLTPKQNWLVVTSAYHMPRALSLFRKIAERTETKYMPYVTDYKTTGAFTFDINFDLLGNLDKLDMASHEYAGIIVNYLMGRSYQLWPCSLQAKVLE